MPRSDFTKEELRAKAMLLGLQYDALDHTFYEPGVGSNCYDADTMNFLGKFEATYSRKEWDARIAMVRGGELGASDYDDKKD